MNQAVQNQKIIPIENHLKREKKLEENVKRCTK